MCTSLPLAILSNRTCFTAAPRNAHVFFCHAENRLNSGTRTAMEVSVRVATIEDAAEVLG